MGKMLYCLITTTFCLSNFLFTHPHPAVDVVSQKEVMAACAVKYLQSHPEKPLTIKNLSAHKSSLVRTVSGIVSMMNEVSLHRQEQMLIKKLVEQGRCPVKNTPPSSPQAKRRKTNRKQTVEMDCPVPTTPVTKSRADSSDFIENASKQVNRLHRQWKTKWSSDGDLQAMLQESTSPRKRANSNS